MSESLAIDRFRSKPLPDALEEQAQTIAAQLRRCDGDVMLGYLSASVAVALERSRWKSRDRLAVDLRVVEIVRHA